MSSEEEDSRATWQNRNINWDQSFDPYDMPPLEEDQEEVTPNSQAYYTQAEDEEEFSNPSPFSSEGLQQIGRQFSFVLVPLLFALVICVITLPFTLPDTLTRHISFLPMLILLIALAIGEGTALYFAGANDNVWLVAVSIGFCLFVLLGSYAVFGIGFTFILFIILLVLGIILAQRTIRPVPEGRVDIVYAFGKYSRTLFPGFNLIRPWERVSEQLNVRETLWICPKQRVSIQRGQEVEIIAQISYQLMPEDAYLAVSHVQDWENSLRDLFITTIHRDVHDLSPDEFTAPHRKSNSSNVPDPNIARLWDRVNARLWGDMQDQVAHWGVQVNWIQTQELHLLPHLHEVAAPGNVRPMGMGATRGAGFPPPQPAPAHVVPNQQFGRAEFAQPAPAPVPVNPPPPPPPAAAASDQTVAIPRETNNDVLIEAYEAVRTGRITDPNTIREIAKRFMSIARNPEVNNNFPFDADRAGRTLFQRAKWYEDQANADAYEAHIQDDIPRPRRANDNLMAGG